MTLRGINSPEVNAIMGTVPSVIIRLGTTIIAVIVLVLLSLTWLIKYPETVQARINLTTKIPPLEIANKVAGNLILFKIDGQHVKENEIVGYLKNSIEYKDIADLKKDLLKLEKLIASNTPKLDEHLVNQNLIYGSLQSSVTELKQSLYNYNNFNFQFNSEPEINSLLKDRDKYLKMNLSLEKQQSYSVEQFRINSKRFLVDSMLFVKKVITSAEFDQSKISFSQAKSRYESVSAQIINNALQISKIDLQVKQLQRSDNKSKIELLNIILNNLNIVNSEIANWEYLNLLSAPTAGKVSFQANIVNNQFVNLGQRILVINPDDIRFLCTSYVPMDGFGRIAIGQHVNIRFDNFPATDFGTVSGIIEYIANIPVQNTYMIRVKLVDGLKTSYRKKLKFSQEMQGTAEIVTQDMRLIERVFNKFRSLIQNN